MRIAKNTTQLISEAPSLRFMLVVDLMDGDVTLEKEGNTLLSLALDGEGSVHATLNTPCGTVTLVGADAKGKEVILTASYARYGLYVGGVLLDEDFFLSPIDYIGATVKAGSFMHFEAGYEYHSMMESAIVRDIRDALDGFRPVGREMSLSRPFAVPMRDRLHLFYLDVRRGGSVKCGAGANRLCALFSEDGKSFHNAPIALAIDSVEEKRMVDASPVTVEDRTYLYYLVDYRTHRALTAAVSDDGFSYLKTGLDIEIPGVDNRDITSVSVFAHGEDVFLAYTAKGCAYITKSIDLLHFEPARPLRLSGGVDNLYAASVDGKTVFFAEREGKTVYAAEGEPWKPIGVELENARPLLFGDMHLYVGTENGALKTCPFSLN